MILPEEPFIEIEEPFPWDGLDKVFDWALPHWKHVASDAIPKDRDAYAGLMLQRLLEPTTRTWGVRREGDLRGLVTAGIDPTCLWVARPHLIFHSSLFGAAESIGRWIFGTLFDEGIVKIEMWPQAHSTAVRALCRRLGGTLEAEVSTSRTTQDGKPITYAIYRVYKDEFEKRRAINVLEFPAAIRQLGSG